LVYLLIYNTHNNSETMPASKLVSVQDL